MPVAKGNLVNRRTSVVRPANQDPPETESNDRTELREERLRMSSSWTGTEPPTRPVLPPWGTTAIEFSLQYLSWRREGDSRMLQSEGSQEGRTRLLKGALRRWLARQQGRPACPFVIETVQQRATVGKQGSSRKPHPCMRLQVTERVTSLLVRLTPLLYSVNDTFKSQRKNQRSLACFSGRSPVSRQKQHEREAEATPTIRPTSSGVLGLTTTWLLPLYLPIQSSLYETSSS